MNAGRVLGPLSALPPGTARGFTADCPEGPVELLVVNDDGQPRAYRNRCPHRGIELNWFPDQFLDRDGREILCTTHGARFRIADGACLGGPCGGEGLEPLPVLVRDGLLVFEGC